MSLQKHPDLETCKAISHLFNNSELVWVIYRIAKHQNQKETPVLRLRNSFEEDKRYGQDVDLLANAPDCVELLKWAGTELWIDFSDSLSRAFHSENIVQELAKSIKRIVECAQ